MTGAAKVAWMPSTVSLRNLRRRAFKLATLVLYSALVFVSLLTLGVVGLSSGSVGV